MRKALFVLGAVLMALCARAVDPSGTLPILYINTENSQDEITKEKYVKATCWLDPKGQAGVDAIGSQEAPVVVNIKGRGNYTWTGFDKKPYKLKFDKKQPLMGMKKSKQFVLLAHADDNLGFMRNASGLETSRLLGLRWTPGDKPVEFVLNGDYRGLYFVTENIKVDEDRVNIFEMADNATDDVTGGWLVEIDNYDTDPHVSITEGNGAPIIFTYKSPEVLSAQQETYLTEQVTTLNRLIYGDKNSAELWNHLDIEEAARFYIVQELLDDCESYHGSCYIFKDKGADSKWMFGPVWDFGNAFQRGPKSQFVWQDPTFNQTWIGEIYKFPAFQAKVKEVWKNFCDSGYAALCDYLTEYATSYAAAAESDKERWPNYGNSNIPAKLQTVLNNLNQSATWLGNQWGKVPELSDPSVEVFLRGFFNGWDTTHKFNWNRSDKVWSISGISMEGDKDFKIANDDWKVVDYGATEGKKVKIGEPYKLTKGGENMTLENGVTDYTFIFDPEAETLLVTNTSSICDVIEAEDAPAEYFTLQGVRVDNPTAKGIYIVRRGSSTSKLLIP